VYNELNSARRPKFRQKPKTKHVNLFISALQRWQHTLTTRQCTQVPASATDNVCHATTASKELVIQPVDLAIMQVIYRVHCNNGHIGGPALQKVLKQRNFNATLMQCHVVVRNCPSCLLEKMRSPDKIKDAAVRPDGPNKVISVDFIFIQDHTAYVITDRFSKFLTANFIRSKSEIVVVLREYLEDAAKTRLVVGSNGCTQMLRQCFIIRNYSKYSKEYVLGRSCSPPYQHDKNGDVESEIKYLKQLIRIQLLSIDSEKLLTENLQCSSTQHES